MQGLHVAEVRFRIRAAFYSLMQKKRLDDEKHDEEEKPHEKHGMHPPKIDHKIPLPHVAIFDHPEASAASQKHPKARLPGKAPFEAMERS